MPITIPARDATQPSVTAHLERIEQRLDTLERRVERLESATAEIDRVKALAGTLKYELEDMRE